MERQKTRHYLWHDSDNPREAGYLAADGSVGPIQRAQGYRDSERAVFGAGALWHDSRGRRFEWLTSEAPLDEWEGDPRLCAAYTLSRFGARRLKRSPAYANGTALSGDTRAMRRALPFWTRADHDRASEYHRQQVTNCDEALAALYSLAARLTFGRDWQFGDYRVSGIGSDSFPDWIKQALRELHARKNAHESVSQCHKRTRAAGAKGKYNETD